MVVWAGWVGDGARASGAVLRRTLVVTVVQRLLADVAASALLQSGAKQSSVLITREVLNVGCMGYSGQSGVDYSMKHPCIASSVEQVIDSSSKEVPMR